MENNVTNNSVNEKNIKLYSILAYIGILWIVGCLVKEKNDKKLRFHVGQGMLITLLNIAVTAVNRIVIYNVFTNTTVVFGTAVKTVSSTGYAIASLLSLAPLVFMIIGIVNAANNKEQELPLIGQLAFYK
jgi:uncharacterized membrane protein